MGVSRTRWRPNSLASPLVTPKTPPQASSPLPSMWGMVAPPATSSPIRITVGSRRISSRIASLMASRKVKVRVVMAPPPSWITHIDVGQALFERRIGALVAEAYGFLDDPGGLGIDLSQFGLGHQTAREHLPLETLDRVACPIAGDLVLGAIGHAVTLEMAVVAEGSILDKARPFAAPRPGDGLSGNFVDGKHVGAVHQHARHVIGRGSFRETLGSAVIGVRRGLGVQIVLADEEHGQLPDGRQGHVLLRHPPPGPPPPPRPPPPRTRRRGAGWGGRRGAWGGGGEGGANTGAMTVAPIGKLP